MRSRLSLFVRFGGILFLLVGIVYLRDATRAYTEKVKSIMTSWPTDVSSVAGVTSSIVQSGRTTREVMVIVDTKIYPVTVEEARTDKEKRQGLMNREMLCENCGMIFFNNTDTTDGYWMKNCRIPLDIIFISKDKDIVDIKKSFQPCTQSPCPVYRPSKSYRYVLEVNGGWAETHGLTIRDVVSF